MLRAGRGCTRGKGTTKNVTHAHTYTHTCAYLPSEQVELACCHAFAHLNVATVVQKRNQTEIIKNVAQASEGFSFINTSLFI